MATEDNGNTSLGDISFGDILAAFAVGIGGSVLKPIRPRPGPASERWGVGVGEAAASLPWMPGPVRGLARQLNQFGSVVVSPGGIEYDGDEVAWSKVSEIRTRRLVGYLATDAITKQVNRLPLWRFPGRARVLNAVSQAALTAVAVAADLRLDRGVFTLCVPAEVQYRGLVRTKQMSAGMPAALVLADPAVRDLVESTAKAHGIPVRMADHDALEVAAQRAAAIRSVVTGIGALVGVMGRSTAKSPAGSTALS